MRFLLKASSSSARNTSKVLASTTKVVGSAAATTPTAQPVTNASGKAWGQQCGSTCGCVLRIETSLSECLSSASPRIVGAEYHAKRVLVTAHKSSADNDNVYFKPLSTQSTNSQPILTTCTCSTLHHLASQTVEHIEGKTLEQIRNDMELGTLGTRSSVAFRHTVLKENVLPTIAANEKKKFGLEKSTSAKLNPRDLKQGENGVQEMNSTQRHNHCYDLVEDALLSMIHNRMPTPRDVTTEAGAYSPTLGGYFRMYHQIDRNTPLAKDDDGEQDDKTEQASELSSIHEASDWQRRSPSSFFLFGDESSSQYSSGTSFTGLFLDQLKESMNTRLFGNETKVAGDTTATEDRSQESYHPTTYLQLLDMYGNDESNNKSDADLDGYDDWLEYVDSMRYHDDEGRSNMA